MTFLRVTDLNSAIYSRIDANWLKQFNLSCDHLTTLLIVYVFVSCTFFFLLKVILENESQLYFVFYDVPDNQLI